tara:strand:- start:1209 stop:1610 length:402 start_codon:yes stop_codon:yes gene_type:complete
MAVTSEQQYYYNQTNCGCQARAIVEENVSSTGESLGTFVVTGCEDLGSNYNYCPNQPNYSGTGQFVVDLFTPDFISSVGGLFVNTNNQTGQPISANDDQFIQKKKSQTGLIVVSIVSLAIIIGVIMLLRKKKK